MEKLKLYRAVINEEYRFTYFIHAHNKEEAEELALQDAQKFLEIERVVL